MTTDTLWSTFREGLQRFLRTRLPTAADADDVLQDGFVRIHEGVDRLAHEDRVQRWVYGIAHRAVADFYRLRSRRAPLTAASLDTGAEPAAPDAVPSENLSRYAGSHDVHEEVLSWLLPLIDALPDGYGTALRMADVEGRTQQEVAEALGLSLSGAKSRVQRARVLLGNLLHRCCAVEFNTQGRAIAFQRLLPPANACEEAACA